MSNLNKTAIRYLVELLLMIFLYAVLDNVAGIKKYVVVIVIGIVFFFLGKRKKWSADIVACVALPVVIYVFLGSLSALISVNIQSETLKVILYKLVPLFFSICMFFCYQNDLEHMVHIQFLGSCLAYKIFDAPFVYTLTTWESVYAFTFGIFVIYYAYRKNWRMFALAVFFLILGEKRIGILAAVVALCVMLLAKTFRYNMKLILGIWGVIITAIYAYLYAIYSGAMEAFCWAANINTNGRVEIYSRMANEFEFSLGHLGKGLGTVEYLLEHWNVAMYGNLHNDLLKIYIELGFLGFLIYLLSFGVLFYYIGKRIGNSRSCFLLGLIVYTMFVFATDNISIYMIYLIPLYSVMLAVVGKQSE